MSKRWAILGLELLIYLVSAALFWAYSIDDAFITFRYPSIWPTAIAWMVVG